jgi:hypothetical protein
VSAAALCDAAWLTAVPCGEYLWDLRNASLTTWMVEHFVLGPTGLGNANVSGFYFGACCCRCRCRCPREGACRCGQRGCGLACALDDGWTNTSAAIQPWQPKEGFCDHSPIGGATEEDFNCAADMGLTQDDTTAIFNGWRATINAVNEAVLAGA